LLLPLYTAVKLLEPPCNAEVVQEAIPADKLAVPQEPIIAPPTLKATVPVACDDTTAVSTTEDPNVDDVGDAVKVVELGAGNTTKVSGELVEPMWVESPRYDALSVCVPPSNDAVVHVAVPADNATFVQPVMVVEPPS
jgi:hypothetical protein